MSVENIIDPAPDFIEVCEELEAKVEKAIFDLLAHTAASGFKSEYTPNKYYSRITLEVHAEDSEEIKKHYSEIPAKPGCLKQIWNVGRSSFMRKFGQKS